MKKHNSAFTLIELLIAILIFSIIASIVYSTFSTGTSVWKRTKDTSQTSMNINSVLEDLAKNLRGAIKYKTLDFIGEKKRFYFCHLSNTIAEESSYMEIYRSCYFIDTSGGAINLILKSSPLLKQGFNIDEAPKRMLISSLDDFKVEYAYEDEAGEIEWREEWENPDDIPRAMKIDIHKGNTKLTKYISIPTGKLISSEAE